MRLRTFTGKTTAEAMALVRTHLGPDAVIVSAKDDGQGGMRVTAALDNDVLAADIPADTDPDLDTILSTALIHHGIAPALCSRLVDASRKGTPDKAATALAAGLAAELSFQSLSAQEPRTVILVGPQGSGKTVTAAKLATRYVLEGKRVRIITTDLARAGAVAQIEAFARILQVPVQSTDNAAMLTNMVAAADPIERIIIDTAGINPFNDGDRRELEALIGATNAEPVLILAAGGDSADTIDIVKIFAALGCHRAVVTRIDAARRLGSIVTAAYEANMALAEAGIAPDIADGITPLTSMLLARLLLPKGAS